MGKKTLYIDFEVTMKRISVFLLLLLAMTVMATDLSAQSCDLVESLRAQNQQERVIISSACGVAGQEVLIPVAIKNDSIATVFQILFTYDMSKLTPVWVIDSSVNPPVPTTDVQYVLGPRFPRHYVVDSNFFPPRIVDSTDKFTVTLFNALTSGVNNVVACNMLPSGDQLDSLPGGFDIAFWVKFRVNASLNVGDFADFQFYREEVFLVDTTVFPPDTTFTNACNSTQMTVQWSDNNTIIDIDTVFSIDNGVVPPDTTIISIDTTYGYSTLQRYPRLTPGTMSVDTETGCDTPGNPQVLTLTANPTSVQIGNSSTLSWTTQDADSCRIYLAGTAVATSLPANGSSSVTPPSTAGNYSYQLRAYGNSIYASRDVTVTVGTVNPGNAPTFTLNPTGPIYNTEQGQAVNFSVSATDPDGKQVTLTASNLPANASFSPNPAVGVPTATGNFTFTPDFNQSGSYAITFTAVDADLQQSTTAATIVVTELQFDRLFSTSAENQNPVGGLRGAQGVYFPINLVTSQPNVYGVQFDFGYPTSVLRVDSFVTSGRIPEWVVYDNIGDSPGLVRVVTFGLANEPAQIDTTSAILWAVMSIDSSAIPWTDYPVTLTNGRESVNPDPNVGSLELVTESGIIEIDSLGDVNTDRFIDVADAVSIVGYIIGDFGFNRRQFATGDIIINDTINVFDLVGVVNSIYGIPISPTPSPVNPTSPVTVALNYDPLQAGGSGVMSVNADIPEALAGVQLQIDYDPSAVSLGIPRLTADNQKFSIRYKDNGHSLLVLMYHLAPFKSAELIQAGLADLVDIPVIAKQAIESNDKTKMSLRQAYLSTASAAMVVTDPIIPPVLPFGFELEQNYPNPFNPTTTIMFEIGRGGVDGLQHVSLEVFNVLGQRVTTLVNDDMSPGSYTIEWDATTTNGQRVATGLYLYRLRVGDEAKSKKMLFLK